MSSLASEAGKALLALTHAQGLSDPSWVVELDEFDEPPLWGFDEEASFLRRVPRAERGALVVGVALKLLEDAAREAARRAADRSYLMSVTLYAEDFVSGGSVFPRTNLFVDPNHPRTLPSGLGFVEAKTREGLETAAWLKSQPERTRKEFWVSELAPSKEPEFSRVYIGWKRDPYVNVRSTGRYRCDDK